MKIFIVQEEVDGIPQEPNIFKTEKQANKAYVEMVKEILDEECDQPCTTFEEAYGIITQDDWYVSEDWYIRYWIMEV